MKIFTLLSVILGINFALADNSTIELLSTDDEISRTQIMETDLSSGDKIKATIINKKFQAILKQYNISIVFDKIQEGRKYSDGSYASSCLEYVQDRPKYKGITGNGFYLVDRNQDGNIKKVYCNQEIDGGGWTLVAHKLGSDSGFFNVAAYGEVLSPFSGIVGKYSDAEWNSYINTDGTLITFDCLEGELKGNLIRKTVSDLTWSSIRPGNQSVMRAFPSTTTSFVTGDTNAHCTGPQVGSIFDNNSNAYPIRWTSGGGCSYIGANSTLGMGKCSTAVDHAGFVNAWAR